MLELKTPFQSTLPARAATFYKGGYERLYKFQSTLPARAATSLALSKSQRITVSIHAARAGSDARPPQPWQPYQVSIHAARAGSDIIPDATPGTIEFQSTLPARAATTGLYTIVLFLLVSIHAARAGSDIMAWGWDPWKVMFQSTLPARAATLYG